MNKDVYKPLLASAYKLASQSPDPSTQIGAFLISPNGQQEWLTQAWNRPVRGYTMLEQDWDRPRKYALLEHAERNCLYNAARNGICTVGCTMVASWAACADCSRAIVECGIIKLVRHYPPLDQATERWLESVSVGDSIMKAGGVELIDVIGQIPGSPTVLRDGAWFDPALGDI